MKRRLALTAALLTLLFALAAGNSMADAPYQVTKVLPNKDLPGVTSLDFNPDATLLASGHADGTVSVWDMTAGKITKTLKGHTSFFSPDVGQSAAAVNCVTFSPDGRILASAGSDSAIVLWDTATWEKTKVIKGARGIVLTLRMSPDGTTLAAGGTVVSLWNPDGTQKMKDLEGHTAQINTLAYTLDGKILASGSSDRTVILWDAATGSRLRTLDGRSRFVQSIDINAQGLLVSAGNFPSLLLWNTSDGARLKRISTLQRSVGTSVRFTPDGKTITAGFANGIVAFYDIKTDAWRTFASHRSQVSSVTFTKDGNLLATADISGKILLWSPAPPPPAAVTTGTP